MKRQNLDRQWKFILKGHKSENTIVDLPHDYSIIQKRDPNTPAGASNGFFTGGVASYEKVQFIPETWRGKKVILELEGVYMNSTVRINSQMLIQHPYGYTSFHCDLTPYLQYGMDNTIRVNVNNGLLPNTRWYSGSGIYRHVWLLVGEEIHITPWGINVATPEVSKEEATVLVKTTIENSGSDNSSIMVRSTLVDANGTNVVSSEVEEMIFADSTIETVQTLKLSDVNLWSVKNPYLYTLKSEIIRAGVLTDSTETKIGIRSISFDAKNGFRLNGITMKLKGACIHHDSGLLGAAAYDRAEERKIELLQACGFNSVRCAHNPPSPALLDVCDRLGMLVIDEAFDCWREPKNINDYGSYFEDWWQRDVASMIIRDRNHPCIIMWSTGNEIPERSGRSDGYNYARKLADYVRSLDNTRAVTNALNAINQDPLVNGLAANMIKDTGGNDFFGDLSLEFIKPLDTVGYNYLLHRYESDGVKFPERVIYGAETFAKEAFDYWEAVEKMPHVIGDFVWAGVDYLGEAGLGYVRYNGETGFFCAYPWHHAYCGDIDICGFKQPQSYYRDCVWGVSKAPYIAVYRLGNFGKPADVSPWGWPDVVSSWTWPGSDGKPTEIYIYSMDSEVELFLNGKSLGRKPAGKANRYTTCFEATYEAGELLAVGYEKGIEVSRSILRTAGAPAAISLKPDRSVLKSEFGDLSYITVELVDACGNPVHNATNNIYFTACGVGSLLAVGNGNPMSEEMYVGNKRMVYEGRAMVVVRCNGEIGDIVLTAMADGISSASVTIKVK